MASASTTVRNHVKAITEATFPAITVEHDRLGRSAGKDGTVAAVFPEVERQKADNVNVLIVEVVLQIHLAYVAEPESQTVNPTTIETYADALRTAFQDQSIGGVTDFWSMLLTEVTYPDDPTGNKTRLEARFTAHATNFAALG